MTTDELNENLIAQIKVDPTYRDSFKTSISGSFYDQARKQIAENKSWHITLEDLRKISNDAADSFLEKFCKGK